jgi:hypothetical protein
VSSKSKAVETSSFPLSLRPSSSISSPPSAAHRLPGAVAAHDERQGLVECDDVLFEDLWKGVCFVLVEFFCQKTSTRPPKRGRKEKKGRDNMLPKNVLTSFSGEKERIPLMRSCGWKRDRGRERKEQWEKA